MARTKITLDSKGMEALLKGQDVATVLDTLASSAAARAEANDPGHASGAIKYHVRSKVGRTRYMAWVSAQHPLSYQLERKYGPLRAAARSI